MVISPKGKSCCFWPKRSKKLLFYLLKNQKVAKLNFRIFNCTLGKKRWTFFTKSSTKVEQLSPLISGMDQRIFLKNGWVASSDGFRSENSWPVHFGQIKSQAGFFRSVGRSKRSGPIFRSGSIFRSGPILTGSGPTKLGIWGKKFFF